MSILKSYIILPFLSILSIFPPSYLQASGPQTLDPQVSGTVLSIKLSQSLKENLLKKDKDMLSESESEAPNDEEDITDTADEMSRTNSSSSSGFSTPINSEEFFSPPRSRTNSSEGIDFSTPINSLDNGAFSPSLRSKELALTPRSLKNSFDNIDVPGPLDPSESFGLSSSTNGKLSLTLSPRSPRGGMVTLRNLVEDKAKESQEESWEDYFFGTVPTLQEESDVYNFSTNLQTPPRPDDLIGEYFDLLPDEVICQIFSYVLGNNPIPSKNRMNSQRICKRFNIIVTDVIQNGNFNCVINLSSLEERNDTHKNLFDNAAQFINKYWIKNLSLINAGSLKILDHLRGASFLQALKISFKDGEGIENLNDLTSYDSLGELILVRDLASQKFTRPPLSVNLPLSLQVLSFKSMCLGDKEIENIAQQLPNLVNLQVLRIHGDRITDEGIKALSQTLPRSNLQELILTCDDLPHDKWEALFRSFSTSQLTKLTVNSNLSNTMSYLAAPQIFSYLPSTLQKLSLNSIVLNNDDVAGLSQKLPELINLNELDIYNGVITKEAMEKLCEAFPKSTIKILTLINNHLSRKSVEILFGSLPDNIELLDISGNALSWNKELNTLLMGQKPDTLKIFKSDSVELNFEEMVLKDA